MNDNIPDPLKSLSAVLPPGPPEEVIILQALTRAMLGNQDHVDFALKRTEEIKRDNENDSEAEPIMVWQGKEQRAVLEAQIGSEIGFIKGTAENLICYIGLNQLGKKYRRMTKAAFNYAFDNHMDIINEQEVPMMMRELTESERLNGY